MLVIENRSTCAGSVNTSCKGNINVMVVKHTAHQQFCLNLANVSALSFCLINKCALNVKVPAFTSYFGKIIKLILVNIVAT